MTNPSVRVARWSAHHPWRAIAGWLLFVAVCLGAGISLGGKAATAHDFWVGEAGRGEAYAAEGGLQQRALERVLIAAKGTAPLDRARGTAVAQDVRTRMARLPEVESAGAPVWSADGRAVRVDVVLRGPELEGRKHVDPVLAQTDQVRRANPDLAVDEAGSPSISKDVQGQRGSDLSRTELFALPVTLLVLLLVFRSLVMAVVPLLLAVSSIAAAVGLSMVASHVFPDAGVGMNVILLIGMAVGVDYTLFYLKRDREERAKAGGSLSSAAVVELAAATSGRAVVVSGLAVAVTSATLYLADDVIFGSLATGAIVVAMAAVVSSLTVLPALLAKLGGRSARRADRSARRGRRGTGRGGRDTGRVGRPGWFTGPVLGAVARRPAVLLGAAVAAMLALAAPMASMKLTDVGRETYSRELPAMRSFDRVNAAFPELKAVDQVVVRADAARQPEVAAALDALAGRVEADPLFDGRTRVRVSADHRVTMLEVPVPAYPSQKRAQDSLERLRAVHVPATVGRIRADVAVTGDVARYADYPEHQKERLPLILGALLLVTFAVTVFAFRSAVLGLVGVVLNLLSAAASLGVLTVVFQHRWAEGLLGFTSMGSVGSRVPLFLFVILFGLSMDYQVFTLSRVQELVRSGVPARRAVLDGIGASAGVVTSAAVVMMTVFASFVPLHLIEMKQFGLSLAVAVLLDAFVIRLVVLPAMMLLLGDAAWWPSRRTDRTAGTAGTGTAATGTTGTGTTGTGTTGTGTTDGHSVGGAAEGQTNRTMRTVR
ncbi:MMPL family transporter [Actinomadura logoneensis]|uniref:MMPL family transporter n=1 Tax=Actinomadura logoneensis TaxID=2293572 RepID=A0A372JVA4_9ACTN|nr:MMPL family transporter [Actinomadura logoneensis]RFU43278.1 MMPL family transporter [Actinomadura logoneensis]